MNYSKIDIGISKIDRIFHCSDIHIRNLKRHKEYKEVFIHLRKEIRARKTKNSVIFVGGDIAHSKTDMSPELISLVSDFLKYLANIAPTIVIPGNHDANLANKSRMDVLSPIIDNLNHPKLHYIKQSGIYNIAGIDFVHMSVFDEHENYIKASESTAKCKVAMFHGPVNQSVTDVGYVVNNRSITLDLFEGYDAVLMGDIHKYQILQKRNKKEKRPIVLYPGSLIQQNHGETLKGHGMVIWDTATWKHEFVEIGNEYGYYTLRVNDGIVPAVKDMPTRPRLRVMVSNTSNSDIKRVITDIKKIYKVQEFTLIRTDTMTSSNQSIQTNLLFDLNDIDFQNKLIDDYIEDNGMLVDDETKSKIRDINRDLNTRLVEENIARNLTWVPHIFKFDNMFSYGEGNIIDFTKMSGMTGIFGPNAGGKSSIFDALSFCLFDKSSRAFKAEKILNDRRNQFKCSLHFKIENTDYYIERTAKKNKKGDHVKVNVEFWTIDADTGEKVSLNGEERRDTDRIIRQYVGSYEDFVLTSLSLQQNNALFIDKSQTERKDLLSKFLGLDVFDKLYNLAVEEIREKKYILRKFQKEDFTSDLAKLEMDIVKFGKADKEQKTLRKSNNSVKISLEKKIAALNIKLHNINDSILDVDKLLIRKKTIIDNINLLKTQEDDIKLIIDDINITNKELVAEFDKLQKSNIEKEIIIYSKKETKYAEIVHEIDKLKISVSSKLEKLKHLEKHKYDPNCKYCMNNIFVKDAITTKNELANDRRRAEEIVNDKNSLKEYLDDNIDILTNYIIFKKIIDDRSSINEKLLKAEKELGQIVIKHHDADKQLQLTKSNIDDYYKNEKLIKENIKIEAEIDILADKLSDVLSKLTIDDDLILGYHGQLSSLTEKRNTLINLMDESKQLESDIKTYEFYIKSVKRDGIPYQIIGDTLPSIQAEMNNILQQMVDFSIQLETDGKNINARIVYEDRSWPLELTSGMERFVSGLAIRVALTRISNLPRPNFLVIDEGAGALDSDKLNSLYVLFQYLKSQFDFVIMISHIDQIRDMADQFIDISKSSKGFSKITYF